MAIDMNLLELKALRDEAPWMPFYVTENWNRIYIPLASRVSSDVKPIVQKEIAYMFGLTSNDVTIQEEYILFQPLTKKIEISMVAIDEIFRLINQLEID